MDEDGWTWMNMNEHDYTVIYRWVGRAYSTDKYGQYLCRATGWHYAFSKSSMFQCVSLYLYDVSAYGCWAQAEATRDYNNWSLWRRSSVHFLEFQETRPTKAISWTRAGLILYSTGSILQAADGWGIGLLQGLEQLVTAVHVRIVWIMKDDAGNAREPRTGSMFRMSYIAFC